MSRWLGCLLMVLLVLGIMPLAGCIMFGKDKGALYVEFGTRIEFGSDTSKTHGEQVYVGVKPLVLGTIAEELPGTVTEEPPR